MNQGQTAHEGDKRRSELRHFAKEAAKTWSRDFGHPTGPFVIALLDPSHPTHDSVARHTDQLVETARAGYE